MKKGFLSQYFTGVAGKRLTAVEVDRMKSNQHEFHGGKKMEKILGSSSETVKFNTRILYFTDQDADPIVEECILSWYDTRKNQPHRDAEYRLYFPDNIPVQCASIDDYLIVARRPDNSLLAVIVENATTMERQIRWLFGLCNDEIPGLSIRADLESEQDRINFASRFILEQIGIEPEEDAPNFLDQMLECFDGGFPKTSVFSEYARSTLPDVSAIEHPDEALICWMEREEILYRTLEKHFLGDGLTALIKRNEELVEPSCFVKLVQSTLQRRRARAGSALENHLEQIFTVHNVTYTRQGVTENRQKPDFIFPGIEMYHNTQFPACRLTMLASKSTCKDRCWQILTEADRIPEKHLITFEPGISENQTEKMKSKRIQLVLPKALFSTYTNAQCRWLMSLATFIYHASSKQKR